MVLARDAANGFAASDLLLAQRSPSSQLLENLNASIHHCAPLTDPFLISEETNIQRVGSLRRKPDLLVKLSFATTSLK